MKKQNTKTRFSKGMSLLEILVVVVIFSMLGIVVTRSIILTLRGSKKSESIFKTRENLTYATSVIERHIRNSDQILSCPFTASTEIGYLDKLGASNSFSCINVGDTGYVASNSARLTNEDVKITACSFSCIEGDSFVPPTITVDLTAQDAQAQGIENSQVTLSTQIQLRTY